MKALPRKADNNNLRNSQATQLQAFLIWNLLTQLSFGVRQKTSEAREALRSSWIATRDRLLADLGNISQMARHGFGHGGAASGGSAGRAKGLIVIVILVLIIPFLALIFSGSTTGSVGIYGNATVSNNTRDSAANFSKFFVVIFVLGAIGIVVSLI
jgi:hypothetical protein